MEWFLFSLILAAVMIPLLRKFRRWTFWISAIAVGLMIATFAAAAFQEHRRARHREASRQLAHSAPLQERKGGYLSSDRCQACHPNQYGTWRQTYHRTMTQRATSETVLAPFDDVSLEVDGERFRLERQGDEFWVEMIDPDWKNDQALAERQFASGLSKTLPVPASPAPQVRKRITLLTGSHHFQVYWVPSSRYGNVQFAFPFAWLISDRRWVPRKDTFVRDPDKPSSIQIWNLNCIKCHSTAGQPGKEEASGRFATRVGELGIACESCHGPAEEHVRANLDPRRRYKTHHANKPDPTIINPARQSAKLSAQICGQCHGIRWTPNRNDWLQHGFSFRPGDDLERSTPLIRPTQFARESRIPEEVKTDRAFLETLYWPDGMIRVTGREYNGLVESPCHQRGHLSCLSCHSMHRSDPDDQLAAGMQTDRACLQCHGSIGKELARHTHHAADSEGSRCYNCHMPHTTYGLLKAIRSHHIESPNVRTTVETGRPNACNLCHLDQTLDWTNDKLSEWYRQPKVELNSEQKTTSAAVVSLLSGNAAQRALVAWSAGWPPAQQASGRAWLVPFLAELLEDPYSAVRYIAFSSLRGIPGYRDVRYDFVSPAPDRARARQQVQEIWNEKNKSSLDRTGRDLLIDAKGELNKMAINELISRRDNRPIELIE